MGNVCTTKVKFVERDISVRGGIPKSASYDKLKSQLKNTDNNIKKGDSKDGIYRL